MMILFGAVTAFDKRLSALLRKDADAVARGRVGGAAESGNTTTRACSLVFCALRSAMYKYEISARIPGGFTPVEIRQDRDDPEKRHTGGIEEFIFVNSSMGCVPFSAAVWGIRVREECVNMQQDNNSNAVGIHALNRVLFRHPLYELLAPDGSEREIHVLILGFQETGRRFADLCLQVGQMDGYTICITAISDEPARDGAEYCTDRPAIREFVNVNGSMNDDENAYGVLNIEPVPASAGNRWFADCNTAQHEERNEDLILSILIEAVDRGYRYNYIFIAEENSDLNRELAHFCDNQTAGQKDRCPVVFVSYSLKLEQDEEEEAGVSGRVYPAYIGPEVCRPHVQEDLSSADTLDRAAFCTHLSWKRDLNFDMAQEYAQFLADDYNYQSSSEFALSIGYKLYSAEIVLRRDWRFADEEAGQFYIAQDEQDAAAEYSRRVLDDRERDPAVRERFNRLVALEHRRWVLSRLSRGWTAPRNKSGEFNLQTCVDSGKVKNEDKKTHPCLVRSSADSPLEGPDYDIQTSTGRRKWDEDAIDPALDPLDQMSVKLHRLFRKKALQETTRVITENGKEVRQFIDPLTRESFGAIKRAIGPTDENVKLAFRQFEFCIRNIYNGEISYTRQYDNYRAAFETALSSAHSCDNGRIPLSGEVRNSITRNLTKIDTMSFPVREANLYRNYKTYDHDLVESIPFILTWKLRPVIAMGFDDARMEGGRNDAVFANVASATILCPSRIYYLYCCDNYTDPELLISRLGNVRNYLRTRSIHCEIVFIAACPEERAPGRAAGLMKQLADRTADLKEFTDGVTTFLAPEPYRCDTAREAIRYFQDSITGRISGIEGCAELFDASTPVFSSSLDNAAFLNCLMSASNESADSMSVPLFELDWKRKQFYNLSNCDFLSYCRDGSFIRIDDMFALQNARVNFPHFDKTTQFPDFIDRFDDLWGIYTGRYCCGSAEKKFREGIANWNSLSKALRGQNTTNHVNGVGIGGKGTDKCGGIQALLNALSAAGFISDLEIRESGELPGTTGHANLVTSFVYSSEKLRSLLSVEGEMLEVHTYYSALKTGYFDEVVCGYKLDWEHGNVQNEIDLILTRGFRSIIVECKNVDELQPDYFYKLYSVANHFGIGTTMVLIGNTVRGDAASLKNEIQQSRGLQMNIATISGERQINHIGEELMRLMQNS